MPHFLFLLKFEDRSFQGIKKSVFALLVPGSREAAPHSGCMLKLTWVFGPSVPTTSQVWGWTHLTLLSCVVWRCGAVTQTSFDWPKSLFPSFLNTLPLVVFSSYRKLLLVPKLIFSSVCVCSWSQFSPSTRILRMEHRSSGLAANIVTCWAILLSPRSCDF